MELLQPGESVNLDSLGALSLRVLPAVEESFDMLLTATAGYKHLCCEQTAAKILAAVFMYLNADSLAVSNKAEEIILAGISRERKMLQPDKGFSMYPGSRDVSEHYSTLAVRYLWALDNLERVPESSKTLREVAREGLAMAQIAARAHGMERVPNKLRTIEEVYAAASAKRDAAQIRKFIDNVLVFTGPEVTLRNKALYLGFRK